MSKGWIGFDLDGTLAHYDGWKGVSEIGKPVPKMVERLKKHLEHGDEVRIFTARVWPLGCDASEVDAERIKEAAHARVVVEEWCWKHLGVVLPVTCVKDYSMLVLYDDRARQVELNTGKVVGE